MALPAALGLSQGFSNVDLNCAEQTLVWSQGNEWRFVSFVRTHIYRTGSL